MNPTPEKSWISEFLERNAWALALIAASLIAQWTIFSYRLTTDEKRLDAQAAKIQLIQDGQNQTAVTLAGIQKDIEYIRLKVDKLAP